MSTGRFTGTASGVATAKARQGLYEYDAVTRLRDSRPGDPRVNDIAGYIVRGKLWEAFGSNG